MPRYQAEMHGDGIDWTKKKKLSGELLRGGCGAVVNWKKKGGSHSRRTAQVG